MNTLEEAIKWFEEKYGVSLLELLTIIKNGCVYERRGCDVTRYDSLGNFDFSTYADGRTDVECCAWGVNGYESEYGEYLQLSNLGKTLFLSEEEAAKNG